MRGVAVLTMIEAHVLDAWTLPSVRRGVVFQDLNILGGFAAPTFLWLAGLGLVLSAERAFERTGDARLAGSASIKRGLEIFILAHLFRLQSFVVSPGGSALKLFRVDILNVMGVALAVAGVAWMLARRGRGIGVPLACFALLTVGVTSVTPVLRASPWVDAMPVWTQWYMRPSGEHTTFTLFPWAGFVFAGSAAGLFIARSRETRGAVSAPIALGLTGAALAGLGFFLAARPSLYVSSSFWTSSPSYFIIRIGIVMAALAVIYIADQIVVRRASGLDPLERFGRSSLFVYWVHVELVYGYATWPLRRHLTLPYSGVAFVAFCVLMYFTVVLRDRLMARWRSGLPIWPISKTPGKPSQGSSSDLRPEFM
jgi:uncharacterized membrane protein